MKNPMESLLVGASIYDRVHSFSDTVLVYVDDVRHSFLSKAPLLVYI